MEWVCNESAIVPLAAFAVPSRGSVEALFVSTNEDGSDLSVDEVRCVLG